MFRRLRLFGTFLFFAISLSAQTVTVNSPGCLAGEEDFGFNGVDANGYNTYYNGFVNCNIYFDMANSKWILAYSGGDLYENTMATFPTPPSTALNPWTSVGICTGIEAIFYGDGTSNSLPVELISFEGRNQQGGVMLQWVTSSELQNEGFQIEYSADGGDWEILDFVAGLGDSRTNTSYEYFHATPSGGLVYYRLVQINTDGSESRSEIVPVQVQSSQLALAVYPNPVEEELIIALSKPERIEGVSIYNAVGQLIHHQQGQVERLAVSTLSSGIYFIRVAAAASILEKKIWKK